MGMYLEFHKLLAQTLHCQLVASVFSIACFALLLQDCLYSLHLDSTCTMHISM